MLWYIFECTKRRVILERINVNDQYCDFRIYSSPYTYNPHAPSSNPIINSRANIKKSQSPRIKLVSRHCAISCRRPLSTPSTPDHSRYNKQSDSNRQTARHDNQVIKAHSIYPGAQTHSGHSAECIANKCNTYVRIANDLYQSKNLLLVV